jgi:hypothetical protein
MLCIYCYIRKLHKNRIYYYYYYYYYHYIAINSLNIKLRAQKHHVQCPFNFCDLSLNVYSNTG